MRTAALYNKIYAFGQVDELNSKTIPVSGDEFQGVMFNHIIVIGSILISGIFSSLIILIFEIGIKKLFN